MQQNYEMFCKRQSSWDPVRTRHIYCTGLAIGPCRHFWYQFLDRILPGRTLRIVGKKVLLDQVVFSPVNIGLFLVILGWLEGEQVKTVVKELQEKGGQLLKAEWIIWPPAQLVNFFFLPTKYRVLYDNTVSLGFDYYYSYVKFRKDGDKQKEEHVNDILPVGHTFIGISCAQQRLLRKHLKDTRKCMNDFVA